MLSPVTNEERRKEDRRVASAIARFDQEHRRKMDRRADDRARTREAVARTHAMLERTVQEREFDRALGEGRR